MKKSSNVLFRDLSESSLSGLTKQVREILHTGFGAPAHKIFTEADLWNIQRQRKSLATRRFL